MLLQAKIMNYRVKVSQRVLPHADEGILTLVRLAQIMFCTLTLEAINQFLYHCNVSYVVYMFAFCLLSIDKNHRTSQ